MSCGRNIRMTIGLTSAFVLGMSFIAAAMTIYQLTNFGPSAGTMLVATEILGSAVLLFVFFRKFNEPLFP